MAAYCVYGVKKPVPFIGGCVLCMCTPEYYTGNFLPFSWSPPELLGGIRYVVKVCFSALKRPIYSKYCVDWMVQFFKCGKCLKSYIKNKCISKLFFKTRRSASTVNSGAVSWVAPIFTALKIGKVINSIRGYCRPHLLAQCVILCQPTFGQW
jgi:hypothetical protein